MLRRCDPRDTDEQLLLRVAQGDQQAFTELHERMAGAVHRVAQRVLRDPAQSEEVAQEVLLAVWRTANRFDAQRGRARSWILTMAHHRAIDRVRSEQARRDRTDRAGARDTARAFDEVLERIEDRSDHQQILKAMATLTELQREAVELAYYHDHTYRGVSELLELPLGTVKSRVRAGLTRLRETMSVVS